MLSIRNNLMNFIVLMENSVEFFFRLIKLIEYFYYGDWNFFCRIVKIIVLFFYR